jgi:hypothetical protein
MCVHCLENSVSQPDLDGILESGHQVQHDTPLVPGKPRQHEIRQVADTPWIVGLDADSQTWVLLGA